MPRKSAQASFRQSVPNRQDIHEKPVRTRRSFLEEAIHRLRLLLAKQVQKAARTCVLYIGLVCGLISRCIRDPPRIIRSSPHIQSLTDVTAAAGLSHSPYHLLAALNFLTTGRPASRPDNPSWLSIIVTCGDLAAPCYMHADGD